ncbi:hypothetical protein Y1Q_0001239 [Alligator mississippiensis]|uniref:Gypsy retrotransposon integrase-like protein 1 n=1 Tax=Alligator mississippiensis TaxID=8496 RepID=A0A151PF96_ALLMI|nr:hypothetical protein Y1Q_0001239 [Alligator mississippiensis]
MLDTGCYQSLLRADLAPLEGRKEVGVINMTCILGGEMQFRCCYVPIRVMQFRGELRVGLAPALACEMILGCEWEPFYRVLERVRATEEERRRIKRMEGWAAENSEPSRREGREGISVESLVSAAQFRQPQREDEELQRLRTSDPGEGTSRRQEGFDVIGELLYQVQREEGGELKGRQLVVPSPLQHLVWRLAHASPLGGHLGRTKTWSRLTQEFFWPHLCEDVDRWGAACPEYQRAQEWGPPKAPPRPMPIIETPFSRVALDIIGLLLKSHNGYQYSLVLEDYATQFPEAVPLRSITAPKVAEELLKWIAWVGIPQEILTDQGTNFMSGVMKAFCKTLGITQLRTSVYHPQTNGLVERLNGTIK